MTVFVLICESVIDYGDQTISCSVFDTKDNALDQMALEFEITKSEGWNEDGFVHDFYIGDKTASATHYLEGEYAKDHIVWELFEKTVTTKENYKL